MLIRCPECQFKREVDLTRIPPTAQLATCPKCKHKFRFREHVATEDGDEEGFVMRSAPATSAYGTWEAAQQAARNVDRAAEQGTRSGPEADRYASRYDAYKPSARAASYDAEDSSVHTAPARPASLYKGAGDRVRPAMDDDVYGGQPDQGRDDASEYASGTAYGTVSGGPFGDAEPDGYAEGYAERYGEGSGEGRADAGEEGVYYGSSVRAAEYGTEAGQGADEPDAHAAPEGHGGHASYDGHDGHDGMYREPAAYDEVADAAAYEDAAPYTQPSEYTVFGQAGEGLSEQEQAEYAATQAATHATTGDSPENTPHATHAAPGRQHAEGRDARSPRGGAKPHRHLGSLSEYEEGAPGGKGDIWDAIAAMGDSDSTVPPFARTAGFEMSIPWEHRGKSGLGGAWWRTVKESLFSPAYFFGGIQGAGGITAAIIFFLFTAFVGALLEAGMLFGAASLLGGLLAETPLAELPAQFADISALPLRAGQLLLSGLVLVVAVSCLCHGCIRFLVPRGKPFATTFRVVAYSGSALLAGCIPVAGPVVARLWFLLLIIKGLRNAHNLRLPQTILAMLPVFMLILGGVLLW